jgi:hypothetical protein
MVVMPCISAQIPANTRSTYALLTTNARRRAGELSSRVVDEAFGEVGAQ